MPSYLRHKAAEPAIHRSRNAWDYLPEFVYGGIDGGVTTFAVVAGAAGAQFGPQVIIVLGFANLIADGFSMSVGNYMSIRANQAHYRKHEAIEHYEVEHMPEREREEVREIIAKKALKANCSSRWWMLSLPTKPVG